MSQFLFEVAVDFDVVFGYLLYLYYYQITKKNFQKNVLKMMLGIKENVSKNISTLIGVGKIGFYSETDR